MNCFRFFWSLNDNKKFMFLACKMHMNSSFRATRFFLVLNFSSKMSGKRLLHAIPLHASDPDIKSQRPYPSHRKVIDIRKP